MKRVIFLSFFLIILGFIGYLITIGYKVDKKAPRKKTVRRETPKKKSPPPSLRERKAIFVPYWANFKKKEGGLDGQDRLIYFGVAVNQKGINRQEAGFRRLKEFKKVSLGKKRWLVLRMTNDKMNQKILADENNWAVINSQLVSFAQKNNFQGLVLDLEPKGIFFDDMVAATNAFIANLHRLSSAHHLPLAILVYGDLFYRHRPFDLQGAVANSEEIMVMAYDFHKSQGEPGPNFPLQGGEKFGYDMEKMTADFLRFVPPDKLTIVFGMYGYDWSVDEKKRPLKKAQIKTLNEIKKEFLDSCHWQNCVVKRDNLSQETEIDYVESKMVDNRAYLYPHIVWFEDNQSVAAKKKFLKTKGISSFARWAWGYF